jgi:DHA1 family bicyclomycin/chloramphenicol resistance-like MFS transporter
MQKTAKKSHFFTILILGVLTALSPFSIDMYLPAFPEIAKDFRTTVSQVSLSLSSYFIGISLGQLFYGPLLDRYGRKRPLYVGLIVYILASVACLTTRSIETLVAIRFLQALGGCAAGVTSMAMVRDLFTTKESAKVFSVLILILGVSPLLAPTVGGYLATAFGWHSVFIVLAVIAALTLAIVALFLPESHPPDHSVKLKFGPIFKNFWAILQNPQFYTYVMSGAVAFSGLFAYLAGSPVIFMDIFGVTPKVYGWIFALISIGLISTSQLNVVLLKRFENEQILRAGLLIQMIVGLIYLALTYAGAYNLTTTIIYFFIALSCLGITNPNSGALAMAPFSKNAGSAAALMGFLQMGLGALSAMLVGLLEIKHLISIIVIMACSAVFAYVILILGEKKITRKVHATLNDLSTTSH